MASVSISCPSCSATDGVVRNGKSTAGHQRYLMATLGRLMSLLSPFDVVIWMTDGWPLYESRLKGKLHVISKRYTQRIERHNLNLRQHLARLGRKSLSFSKSVELHDKVIGHYLNIKHYQ
ncbi:IS1 family transposase [Escherichia coli]|uniref:IS1 family transposase n=1 Tax=Escherichia coli TaxID=562 RepID=UPI001F497B46